MLGPTFLEPSFAEAPLLKQWREELLSRAHCGSLHPPIVEVENDKMTYTPEI